MEGIIKDSYSAAVLGDDGVTYFIDSVRGIDGEGYPQVLIDAKNVGGRGYMQRQSIKPYIGMKVKFVVSQTGHAYNFEILSKTN
ncbi:MAG: hypothetical protein WC979_02505 [Candidatus Pacearchaeota archaeon]|jgi:hypothetical protein|nr:hypothetical protein [Clostridia bacterium]